MKIDRDTVIHIAELARLQLTDEEIELYAGQLSQVLSYAAELQALDTEAIPPTASVLPLSNVLRPDEPSPGLSRDEVLANAPRVADYQFVVDAILDSPSR
ncbi:MAG: Asp-tRNA(Asn)/Glu-tRNA(Gln) amidotransferase subunit GatC [Anaerolineae bacterium]|nr:Asp-tRNA(Asn)/Glu-tRNA(Gln) amidotransferase subunit GatC [Anaerolineae bacterium]